jgi:2-C-methyl-D-erythritol 4-phosphate cytidylyltransferase/2-C-methyl-D-erythritol 2,4-cyclodiphosphate synthase
MSSPTSTVEPSAAADAIVVAAGRSTRMEGIDKLAAVVRGRPLLAWSIDAVARAREVERIVVVVTPERVDDVAAAPWLAPKVVGVVAGGDRRQVSVAAGFAALPPADPDRIVLVHDGGRPLVSPELVSSVVRAAMVAGAAIPVLPVTETVKRVIDGRIEATVDRAALATAQTPQGVRRRVLERGFASYPPDGQETWTDEAALLELCRIAVHAIPGDPGNLKVTVPDDLRRAVEALGGAGRIGYGHDRHPFGPGEPLRLGGLEVEGAPRLHGHSDGDVALHAVADALLGAAGLGDLGRLFPSDQRTPKGVASSELLRDVARRLAAAGYRPGSVDLTLVGARPRLGPRLDEMRTAIAGLLDVGPEVVSVKASSGNLGGPEGEGRAIGAHVVASLELWFASPRDGRPSHGG